jgi:hypothetical protein
MKTCNEKCQCYLPDYPFKFFNHVQRFKNVRCGHHGSVTNSTKLAELQAVSLLVYLLLLTVRFRLFKWSPRSPERGEIVLYEI